MACWPRVEFLTQQADTYKFSHGDSKPVVSLKDLPTETVLTSHSLYGMSTFVFVGFVVVGVRLPYVRLVALSS